MPIRVEYYRSISVKYDLCVCLDQVLLPPCKCLFFFCVASIVCPGDKYTPRNNQLEIPRELSGGAFGVQAAEHLQG
jgi:hypothetical protein